ncbi:MAG TPA: TonB-dependent receptor [Caulobacteraceae bacterium]
MNTSLKRGVGLGGFAASLMGASMLTPPAARAADATAAAAGSQVTEIVVTAEKREENIQSVAMSVQALGAKRMDQLNITEFQDYIKYMPSVTFQTLGPNQTSIYMRGVASGDNANHSGPLPSVGVYLDEQPITTIGGTLDIHVYDISRIEVLPGPQGTLYGASSEAGTLRIITNKPNPSGFSAAYDLQASDWAHGGFGYVAEGYVNQPINDHAAVRLVAWDQHDPGFIANVPGTRTFATSGVTINNGAFVNPHANPADTVGGRLALLVDLDENWTIEPTIIGQHQHNTGFFGYEPSVGPLKYQRFGPDTDTDDWYQAALTVTGKLGRYDLTYSGGYFWRKVDQRTDYTDYSIMYDAVFGSGHYWQDANGNPLAKPQQTIFGQDTFWKESNEARIASPASDRFRFLVGVFQEQQQHWIVQDYVIPGFGPQISVPGWPNTIWLTDQNRIDRDAAGFGEASFDITPQLTLTAGVRGYWFRNTLFGFYGFGEGYNQLTGFSSGMGANGQNCQPGKVWKNAPCVNLDKASTGTGETHKVNLSYKVGADALVYFTYSTGYRPGGVNRSGAFKPYQSDFLSNYEIGWKTAWLDHRLIVDGAVFYEDWTNFQFSFLGPNSLTIVENAPTARVIGVEANAEARPDEHWDLSASLAYTDGRLTKNFCGTDANANLIPTCSDAFAVGNDGALHNTQLPYTPSFKGNFTVRYGWNVMDWRAHVQAAVAYQNSMPVALRAADMPFLQAPPFTNGAPGFTTVDLSAGVERDKIRIELFVKNLFDERGQLNRFIPCTLSTCGQIIPGIPQDLYVVPSAPRVIGIKFGQSF